MPILKLFRAALMLGVVTTGWAQNSPDVHAAHHPPQAAVQSADELAPLRRLIERAELAKTAAERERLLDEHLAAMRKQLETLRTHQCAMEMPHGPGAGGGMKEAPMQCHQMMSSSMETLVELLDQTWRREALRKKSAR